MAGRRALAQLSAPVDAVLLDGNHDYLSSPRNDQPTLFDEVDELDALRALPPEPPVHVRIKADLTCAAVAGASVLAKTERDRLLTELAPRTPSTGSTRTRGTARRSTSPRCARTARAWCTGRAGGCRVAIPVRRAGRHDELDDGRH